MLDSNIPGTDLFVLDSSGNMHKLHVADTSLQEYGSFPLLHGFVPADMAYALSNGQEALLIAGNESGRGVAVNYSLSGGLLKTWRFPNSVCSGIDFGGKARSAYVATADTNEIYRLDLQGTQAARVARISEATKLGPVAFDEAGQQIYVADVASGKIYQYSIGTKASKILLKEFSAPTALIFDPATNWLFIADPGRKGIYTVDTRAKKPAAVPFASDPLKTPYGITLIWNDRVAVADYGANAVLVFSNKGQLLFRFPS